MGANRTSNRIVRFKLLVALSFALFAALSFNRAEAAGTWYWYCYQHLYVENMQCWDSGWNYYYGNYMHGSDDTVSGPLVRVMEHFPNGSWTNTVSGNGWIIICHARVYVETGSQNRASYWIYASSAKRAGGAC